MKAILDWKYNTNGDPMVDVGYFLMMFMQPVDYGYPALARLDLLMGKDNTNGDPMMDVGYFLMMFMQSSDCGYPALERLDPLMGNIIEQRMSTQTQLSY